jgi:hypothetical protein
VVIPRLGRNILPPISGLKIILEIEIAYSSENLETNVGKAFSRKHVVLTLHRLSTSNLVTYSGQRSPVRTTRHVHKGVNAQFSSLTSNFFGNKCEYGGF